MYINNHTHRVGNIEKRAKILQVFALDPISEADLDSIPEIVRSGHAFTLGLHPHSLARMNVHDAISMIRSYSDHMIAVGECGLDTFVSVDKTIQIDAFREQARLAEEIGKPLIIHCVRSHEDILRLRREIRPNFPWIIHGFNRNRNLAEKLLDAGILLSIGKELMDDRHPICEYLSIMKDIPFFLETDGKDIPIEQLYERCASLLNLDTEELTCRIATHFKQVYGTI